MGYSRQTFEDKKTVLTAAHLNHIEDGIISLESVLNSAYIEDTPLVSQENSY